ncbi:MAG: hypothetical protein M0R70_14710 [Nitrospirae bacterium]|nr:hypothetical protein [Nitrospirota bacterium]
MKMVFEIKQNVGKTLESLPGLTYTAVRQQLEDFADRFKSKLARERMSGPPGINWFGAKTLKNSRHFQFYVVGDSLKSLSMVSRISGKLMMHETGGTITPKNGKWLYIFNRKGRLPGTRGTIVAKVRSVTLRPRLQFRATFESMLKDEMGNMDSAVAGALAEASKGGEMKEIT